MDSNSSIFNTFNEVLVKLFNDIMHIEEKAIITDEFVYIITFFLVLF